MNNLKEIVTQIKSVIKSTILTQSDIPEEYSHDELNSLINKPDIVIKATSIEDISNVMKVAYKNNIPVVTRGSGTGLVGGAVSVEGGIIIDTTLMNHILELDEDNLTITVEPGVLLMQLTEFVESKGYFYPPDPGEKTATIGGNIATNAGGMRAVKYGVTGAYVKELTVVLSNGDILNLGSKTVKNSSGYNLTNLIVGSEGTLCIIAKATLKIIPLPTQVISLLVPFKDMQTALNLVNKIIKFKIVPVAIEYMTKETLLYVEKFLNKKFPDTTHDAYILLTFDGSSAEQMKYEYEQVADLCLDNGAIDVLLVDNDDRKKVVWTSRGAFLEAIKSSTTELDECDVVVPRNKMADFILFADSLKEKVGMRIVSFGHAGDGNLHIYLCRDQLSEESYKSKLLEAFKLLYEEATRVGGLVSGEHGIGWAKKSYLIKQYGENKISIMRGIKKVFDPTNILNPSKIF